MNASFLLNSGHKIPLVGCELKFDPIKSVSCDLSQFSYLCLHLSSLSGNISDTRRRHHLQCPGSCSSDWLSTYRWVHKLNNWFSNFISRSRLKIHVDAFISADSAVVYRNEQHIGAALKTLLPKYGLERKDVFITSKLSKFGTEIDRSRNCNVFQEHFLCFCVVAVGGGGIVREWHHTRSELPFHVTWSYINFYLLHNPQSSSLHLLHVTSLLVSAGGARNFLADFSHSVRAYVSNFPSFMFYFSPLLFVSVPSVNQVEEDVIALVRESLRNLQTDYIDLWVSHAYRFSFAVRLRWLFEQVPNSLARRVWPSIGPSG